MFPLRRSRNPRLPGASRAAGRGDGTPSGHDGQGGLHGGRGASASSCPNRLSSGAARCRASSCAAAIALRCVNCGSGIVSVIGMKCSPGLPRARRSCSTRLRRRLGCATGDAHERGAVGLSGRIARAFASLELTPLLMLAGLLAGLAAVLITPREEEPQIEVTFANVFVPFPGAPVADVENLVVVPLSQSLLELRGVKHVYAMARPGWR